MRKEQHRPIRLDKYLGQCWHMLPVELCVFATHFNFSSVDKLYSHDLPENKNEANKLAIMKKALQRQQKFINGQKNAFQAVSKPQIIPHNGQNIDTNQNMINEEDKAHVQLQIEQNQMNQPMLITQQNWYLQSEDSINFFLS